MIHSDLSRTDTDEEIRRPASASVPALQALSWALDVHAGWDEALYLPEGRDAGGW